MRHLTYYAKMATDTLTRNEAFRLRYDSYLHQGYIGPNEFGIFPDRYDELVNSRTIVVYDDDGPVGSVRVCLLGHAEYAAPASESFGAEIERMLDDLPPETFAAEITRLVRSPSSANDQALVFLLYRLANYIGFVERVVLLLASVRRNHATFYKRLGFDTVSEPRAYPGLNCPMQLMRCDRTNYERSFARFPLIDPFGPGADRLDGLLRGETVPVSFFPRVERYLAS